jgi:hypothetical protein
LIIRYVDRIEMPDGGKFQKFTSDFAPATAIDETISGTPDAQATEN